MNLGFRQSWIDKLTAVVDVDNVKEFHLAHGNIHLYLREGAAEGVGVVLNLVGTLGGDMLAVGQT